MALATLVLVIYQGLFIDVITRSLYATGLKSIGIATQPLQSLPTCISLRHFLHPALPFYTLPSARAPQNTASLYCPSSDCSPYAPDCNRAPGPCNSTSTSSSDPCGPALRGIDRVGHLGPLGTGLGALEQEQGMWQLTAALRWLQTCAFPVESGGGRWNSESP